VHRARYSVRACKVQRAGCKVLCKVLCNVLRKVLGQGA